VADAAAWQMDAMREQDDGDEQEAIDQQVLPARADHQHRVTLQQCQQERRQAAHEHPSHAAEKVRSPQSGSAPSRNWGNPAARAEQIHGERDEDSGDGCGDAKARRALMP